MRVKVRYDSLATSHVNPPVFSHPDMAILCAVPVSQHTGSPLGYNSLLQRRPRPRPGCRSGLAPLLLIQACFALTPENHCPPCPQSSQGSSAHRGLQAVLLSPTEIQLQRGFHRCPPLNGLLPPSS